MRSGPTGWWLLCSGSTQATGPRLLAPRLPERAGGGSVASGWRPLLHFPAMTGRPLLPLVAMLEIPSDGYVHGFRVAVVDSVGHELPDEMIHHFNLIDPDHRELFLPISRRLLAAGHETGAVRLPG